MSLRVNHNIGAINAHRSLQTVSHSSGKNLERLSSGLKINRGSDGPASLVVSESMRAQIGGINQALENTENGISMVQVAEGALGEVNQLLGNMRQLAIHASNAGVNDPAMLAADQAEVANSLQAIDRISGSTQFGNKQLLDGSTGASGVANGKGLQFISANSETQNSPVSGYSVEITQAATKASHSGTVALTQAMVDSGETLTVVEGGKSVQFTAKKGDTVESTLNELRRQIDAADLKVELGDSSDNVIRLQHKEFGSEEAFSVSSSTAGVLSAQSNVAQESTRGQDVKGRINGEEALGAGQVLTGRRGNVSTDGLQVRYSGDKANAPGETAGTVTVLQNSLTYQIGANEGQTVKVSLRNMASRALGKGIDTTTGVKSLENLDLTSFQGAQDAIKVIDKAIEQTSTTRAELGAFQKNNLETTLNTLRVSSENLTSAESVIRDADMAKEMAEFTKNQILTQASTSILAHANQSGNSVLALLN